MQTFIAESRSGASADELHGAGRKRALALERQAASVLAASVSCIRPPYDAALERPVVLRTATRNGL
jgi:hypothetical protein